MSPLDRAPSPRAASACPSHVAAVVDALLVCSEETTVPFTACFHYDCSDPYAVGIRFPVLKDGDNPTTWTFARSLLEEGQRVESGAGDVLVVPCGPDYLGLELRNRGTHAVILLSAQGLREFVAETYQCVPAGSEHHFLDIDHDLSRLLGETH
ncbi:SsgA family sporulation/cell division regulator [Streptomyces sp. NPDC013178]|uniref:SsgA family sporulation/cell division regulator n=1 Tax=Streptomyces sp. NPDC013178 TaxID=3155118 RepID=UPI0033F009ED